MTQKKIGIAMSGGGARGVAHLGILQALHEMDIHPSILSGTSAGAIAAAFYAGGYTMKETLSILKKGEFFNFSSIQFNKQGLFSMKGFESIYNTHFPSNKFSDLYMPIHVVATNLLSNEIVYFSDGDLATCLLASSCIPLIFQPISYKNMQLVDGGLVNNLPIEPLLNNCDFLIGLHVNSLKPVSIAPQASELIDRSFHLALRYEIDAKRSKCNLMIEPPNMSQFSLFDVNKLDEIYNYGYVHTLQKEKEIYKTLNS